MQLNCLILISLVLLIRSSLPVYAQGDFIATLKNEWEILSSWDNVDKTYTIGRQLKLWQRDSKDKPGQGEFFESQTPYYVKVSNGCALLQAKSTLLCWNQDYTFTLKKSKVASDGWALGHAVIAPPSENELRQSILNNGDEIFYFRPLTGFFCPKSCDQYLADGELQITGHHFQENKLVKADIRFTWPTVIPGPNPKPMLEKFTGYLILDPQNHYVIMEALITTEEKGPRYRQIRLTRTVEKMNDILITTSLTKESLDGRSFHNMRYLDYRMESTDPMEFRLSYYGLPEPVGVVWERRTPVYVWLFVAAGVLLTLGIFFRWLARRLRRGHSEG